MQRSWLRAAETPGGYAWWYFDALNEVGDGLVCILFLGSVFSPRYASRCRRGERALPAEHAAVNIALYRRWRPFSWTLTEHAAGGRFDDGEITIGSTRLSREGAGFRLHIAERAAPFGQSIVSYGSPVEGTIDVEPLAGPFAEQVLSSESAPARHAWQVIAPHSRVRARFSQPGFSLDAPGYHDRNYGEGRLEDTFARWGWARFHGASATTVVYGLEERSGLRRSFVAHGEDGSSGARPVAVSPSGDGTDALRSAGWGMRIPRRFGAIVTPASSVAAPENSALDVVACGGEPVPALACDTDTLIDRSPFYARFRGRLVGEGVRGDELGLGEWLDLDRFRSPFIQFLLGFKMRFE